MAILKILFLPQRWDMLCFGGYHFTSFLSTISFLLPFYLGSFDPSFQITGNLQLPSFLWVPFGRKKKMTIFWQASNPSTLNKDQPTRNFCSFRWKIFNPSTAVKVGVGYKGWFIYSSPIWRLNRKNNYQ